MNRYFILACAGIIGVCSGASALTGSAVSGVGLLDTVPPGVSNVSADPPVAAEGDTVTITFDSSESIGGTPLVSVNGWPAAFVSSTNAASFEFQYTVMEEDPAGPAAILIDLSDVVGNSAMPSNSTALTILDNDPPEPGVPVKAWPLILLLVVVGIIVMSSRRGGHRRASVPWILLSGVLLATSAHAQSNPTVSNASFTQQPNGVGGTEVVIAYDLISPNGPSDITVSLSKDGGIDGFPFAVTSITGDVSSVSTGTGYTIVWDVAVDFPDEMIPNAQLRLTAEDGFVVRTVEYTAGPGGSITGDDTQSVFDGEDGTAVTAVALRDFVFLNWSDGSIDNPRQDTNITADIDVTANFMEVPVMLSVAAGSFDMGRTNAGDDATYGQSNELPVHTVNLSEYQIGKFEATNQQVCDVFNWANGQGLFTTVNAATATAYGQELLNLDTSESLIEFVDGEFQPETRTGLPGSTAYSMADHPVLRISWYGAAVFCNWLSEIQGFAPIYDTSTWQGDFANDGYHLPTEAQWERAAAWNGAKHWIYGFTSDTFASSDRGNVFVPFLANPLGLSAAPYTSPVGWFDGVNVSPNGNVATVDGPSPVGAYDMSGNVSEWCHDWFDTGYYAVSPDTDPRGPAPTPFRVRRDSSWNGLVQESRTADRISFFPDRALSITGLRLARSVAYNLNYTAGTGGSITGNASQAIPPGGDGTTVTATPNAGFVFTDWSDGETNATRTETTVTSGVNVTANFTEQFTLTYTANTGGSLTGDTSQTVLSGEDGTAVTVVTNPGVFFLGWSDGSTDNPRTDANVTRDVSVTANFLDVPDVVNVPTSSFDMGRTSTGDDASYGGSDELPVHEVALSFYGIGRFEITNQQVCDVFNWAFTQGLLTTLNSATATAYGRELLNLDAAQSNIEYVGGLLQPKSRPGLPGATLYSMADHPVVVISWYGAAVYCNWLSQLVGLAPIYDTATWAADFTNNGFHLPTEAQWERAAAWDGSKHWIYGFTADTLTGFDRANYLEFLDYVNPLGLSGLPKTSPVGWFDGVNVSPNGNVATVDSTSPVGAYDMTGNVEEWCHDWYDSGYYSVSPAVDPRGPVSGSTRVVRGGDWQNTFVIGRSAVRIDKVASSTSGDVGFRIAKSALYRLSYTASAGGTLTGNTSQDVLPGGDGTSVTASPNSGYVFTGWSDGVMTNTRVEVNVDAGVNVTANFLPQYTLTYSAGSNGGLSGSTSQVVLGGEDGTAVTAVPDPGFGFNGWSDASFDNPRQDTNVSGNINVTANFAVAFTLTYTAGANGSISGVSPQTVVSTEDGSAVTAVPDPGYVFGSWSDGSTDNPRTDTDVIADLAVTANFLEEFELSYTAGSGGSITGAASQTVVDGMDGSPVTAVGDNGFLFSQWSDGFTDNPRQDTNVTSDLSVTAQFLPGYFLTYIAGTGGSISGANPQGVFLGADGSPVTAVPNAGYRFADWSDGGTANPRQDTNVTAALTVTANFEIDMITMPTDIFVMGNSGSGDDATFGLPDETPAHIVNLLEYEIGRVEVTNYQLCDIFNWADDQGYFDTLNATTAEAYGQTIIDLVDAQVDVEYVDGELRPKSRLGEPSLTTYAMDDFPAQNITWYGAAALCNWLSLKEGLTPVYNTTTWAANFGNDGYHLPTEAQWERAASWTGGAHRIYGINADTLTGSDRANYLLDPSYVNPMGLELFPYTSPAGWFDGVNVSPNGNVATVDSPSPSGAYDMSGNVSEWVHDWYSTSFYGSVFLPVDPAGPASGTQRVTRGSAWEGVKSDNRTARRLPQFPDFVKSSVGLRLAR